jgi:hypothetical protein
MITNNDKKIKNIKKAYVQTWKGEFANEATYVFFMGAEYLGIPTQKFDFNDIGKLEIDKDTVIAGGITAVRHAMSILEAKLPSPLDIPEELYPFTKRNIQNGTIKYFMENGKFPLFVKPRKPKLFTGAIASCPEELEMFKFLAIEAEEMEIQTSDVVKFVSEHRAFVIEGYVYDCRKYSGNHRVNPDYNFIEETVKAYKSQPISYGIDFGVTDKGETMLIEANDGYSLGTYGFDCYNYYKMVCLRWNEILNQL